MIDSESKSPVARRKSLVIASVCVAVAFATLAVPMYVIRPFRPQSPNALALALAVRHWAPWVSGVCALIAIFAAVREWNVSRVGMRITLSLFCLLAFATACLTHVNIFEIMFKPYGVSAFEPVGNAQVDPDDKVLAVTVADESHAFPVRTMGYHHIVNDVLGGQPIAVTYCTLCHTGLVWSRKIGGGPDSAKWTLLTFRLAGINNGNALLRDEQTNSIWQQSTGEAIFGFFKGRRLTLVHSDELTFAQWRSEQPNGLVLKTEAQYEAEYDPKNWEQHVERTRTVVDTSKTGIAPHELMLGINLDGKTRAYPVKSLLSAGLVQENFAGRTLLVVVGPDHASIRAFALKTGGTPSKTFAPSTGPDGEVMKDLASNTAWNFRGCPAFGEGQCLEPIDSHKTYWFDWVNHNPSTTVFRS